MNSSPRYEDYVIAFCTVHNAHIGAVHKVHHTIFGQFLPPLPPVTLRHTSRDPPKVHHTSRTPPRFLEGLVQKTRTKGPCTNSVLIVRGGFCQGVFSLEGFVQGGFCPFPFCQNTFVTTSL